MSGMGGFENWFGTRYYKLLYRNRNDAEAQGFLDKLITVLQLPSGASVLDVACGQGRHSRYMASLGYDVTGMDVVPANIAEAQHYANTHLRFLVQDMRQPFPVCGFDLVMNLFTSFGYFGTEEEDIQSLQNMRDAMKPAGCLVIDFLNATCVMNKLVPRQHMEYGGVSFDIHKYLQGKYVIKDIHITEGEKQQQYREQVKLLQLHDFEKYFKAAGLTLHGCYGNYAFEPYQPQTSERLVMVLKRMNPPDGE